MKRFVYLRADLKETNALLLRIARALEQAVGIVPIGPDALDGDADVAYSTSDDLVRQEFEDRIREHVDDLET